MALGEGKISWVGKRDEKRQRIRESEEEHVQGQIRIRMEA